MYLEDAQRQVVDADVNCDVYVNIEGLARIATPKESAFAMLETTRRTFQATRAARR